MAAPIPFSEFYQTQLRERLAPLEEARKALVWKYLTALAWAAAAFVIGLVFAAAVHEAFLVGAIVLSVIVFFAGLYLAAPAKRQYVSRFKEGAIRPVIGFIDPRLTYHPDASIGQVTFAQAGIFTHSIDRFSGDDLVSGTVGSTAMRFSELHAEYKTQSVNSKGQVKTTWHTIFKGLFFEADFNKSFHGETFVRTDVAEKLFGAIGQALQKPLFGKSELVTLEDPEFEKEFVVKSTDQQEARYILTPALMARILEFKRKARRDVQFSFIGSSVYAAVPYREDLFEPPVWSSVLNPELLESYYDALRLVVAVVDDLNLNTRIWSKPAAT
jgi:uncharacterized protein DUF3137